MIYDVKEIEKKALKLYSSGEIFISFMQNKSLFPHTIKLKKPTQKILLDNLGNILGEMNKLKNLGLSLEYKEFDFKRMGLQNLPVSLIFMSEEEFLKYLKKSVEFELYKMAYTKSVKMFESLRELFLDKPNLLLQNLVIIDELLEVCSFLQKNPKPNLYIRELSIRGIDTKFIQKNRAVIDMFLQTILDDNSYDKSLERLSENGFEKKYGFKFEEPLIRFRILDKSLYICGLSDMSLPLSEFKKLQIESKNIFIVENKITTLSFPNIPSSIVIFGKGYGVSILKNVSWMGDKNIFYWGDIDMDGFAILSQVKGYFPKTKSLMMNREVLETFKGMAISSTQKSYKNLEFLNDEERLLYERLHKDFYKENFRLEQEKIPFEYIISRVIF